MVCDGIDNLTALTGWFDEQRVCSPESLWGIAVNGGVGAGGASVRVAAVRAGIGCCKIHLRTHPLIAIAEDGAVTGNGFFDAAVKGIVGVGRNNRRAFGYRNVGIAELSNSGSLRQDRNEPTRLDLDRASIYVLCIFSCYLFSHSLQPFDDR